MLLESTVLEQNVIEKVTKDVKLNALENGHLVFSIFVFWILANHRTQNFDFCQRRNGLKSKKTSNLF